MTVTSSPVKSADRVLDIFELLASEPDGLTVSEISSRLGIARSSTHGLVQTVARRGYLRRDHRDGRRVALGASVVQLGLSVTDRLELRTIARGPLERLVAATHDTVLLAVPDHGNLIYVDKIFSDQRGFRTDPRASARSPVSLPGSRQIRLLPAQFGLGGDRPLVDRIEPVAAGLHFFEPVPLCDRRLDACRWLQAVRCLPGLTI